MSHIDEHDGEPRDGLPVALPPGERVLWQGSPSAKLLWRHVYHGPKVGWYFAILVAWRIATAINTGAGWQQALANASGVLTAGLVVLAMLAALAWLSARTTIYSLTTRRVVLRIGIALPMTITLPLSIVDAVDLKRYKRGYGDIVFTPGKGHRASYVVLWPHARPFSFAWPQPAWRSLADLNDVADQLAVAFRASGTLPSSRAPSTEDEAVAIAGR